ncbi:hypothetical protein OIU76_030437 [Salix suchowensis]|nr:hypothetical protein OIU76_030437 [Salix suchowensis]
MVLNHFMGRVLRLTMIETQIIYYLTCNILVS